MKHLLFNYYLCLMKYWVSKILIMMNIQIQIGVSQRCKMNTRRLEFNSQANAVSFLYQKFVNKRTLGLSKITVELFNKENILEIGNFRESIAVCLIDKSFDYKKYFTKSSIEQRKMIIEVAHQAILQMCNKFNLDKTPFINAYNKVIENNYTNKYYLKKLTLSKNRQHKAGIEIDMTENGTDINIVFTDKNENVITRKSVFKTHSHFYFIYQLINSGKWVSNEKYMASSKKKNVNFIASINSNEIELDIKPKEKENEIMAKLNELRYE